MSDRMKGHALRRQTVYDEFDVMTEWSCECGEAFGVQSVHKARGIWRSHKEAVASRPVVASAEA